MERTYWLKQTAEKPLFPDLLWSRPENKRSAGKLLIVGGSLHGFSAVGQAFKSAVEAGAGTIKIVLPDSLGKTVRQLLPEAEFAPSNKSGSFSQLALGQLLDAAGWADGVLLAGDFGKNSETTVLLEKFTAKYQGQLTIAGDSIDSLAKSFGQLLERKKTLLAADFAHLRQLVTAAKFEKALMSDIDLIQLVDTVHTFTTHHALSLLVEHEGAVLVSSNEHVSTTKQTGAKMPSELAASAAVWWLQNPAKTFDALTTSVLDK